MGQSKMDIEKKIEQQIAHCMAISGEQPDELMHKLQCLVLEWYENGLNNREFTALKCPNCAERWQPGHMDWEAFKCQKCKIMVNQDLWEKV